MFPGCREKGTLIHCGVVKESSRGGEFKYDIFDAL
jgi:hypothetical protein